MLENNADNQQWHPGILHNATIVGSKRDDDERQNLAISSASSTLMIWVDALLKHDNGVRYSNLRPKSKP